jgi:ABC-2 type transport system permease protein
MSGAVETLTPAGEASAGGPSIIRIYALEAKYEFLKLVRLPAYAIPTLTFPALFYILFGLSLGSRGGGNEAARYLLATYCAFGVIGASLFAFGIGVATERGQGWLLLKRATPMPPLAYFVGKLAMSLLFGVAIVAILSALGAIFGGVRLPASGWVQLFTTLVGGAIPFCAFGLALGLLLGPNSAPPVVNLIYLPLSFMSGLWMPVESLPAFFQTVAPWLPPYHYAQLALGAVGMGRGSIWVHLAALAGFTVACLCVARWAYRSGSEKMYG